MMIVRDNLKYDHDATIWSVTLELSITLPELSFILLQYIYRTIVIFDHNIFIVQATGKQCQFETF
jgi:hypothetical protein